MEQERQVAEYLDELNLCDLMNFILRYWLMQSKNSQFENSLRTLGKIATVLNSLKETVYSRKKGSGEV